MNKEAILITGANGEIGHGLINFLHKKGDADLLALDMQPLDKKLDELCSCSIQGNILDENLLTDIFENHKIRTVFHLAALLSSSGEKNPELAHQVNVNGTINLLSEAVKLSKKQNSPVKFIYPSTVAVYGVPTTAAKKTAGKVTEDQFLEPITMYGCNKLYCENLGRYFMRHYKLMDWEPGQCFIDFRALRFPGLISAETIPTGGTTDYGPEMIHYAAQNKPYPCFVSPDTQLPFMVMPDAIKSMIMLEAAKKESLTRVVYNVTSFSPTAVEMAEIVTKAFPGAKIYFEVNPKRQMMVDTWPGDMDDTAARNDWGWKPDYDQERAFQEYLIPTIRAHYKK